MSNSFPNASTPAGTRLCAQHSSLPSSGLPFFYPWKTLGVQVERSDFENSLPRTLGFSGSPPRRITLVQSTRTPPLSGLMTTSKSRVVIAKYLLSALCAMSPPEKLPKQAEIGRSLATACAGARNRTPSAKVRRKCASRILIPSTFPGSRSWLGEPHYNAIKCHGHFASGGRDMRMASTLPPVRRPNFVPRSCSRLNSTYRPRRIS